MNDWMADLIFQCLADIPHGKYRDRAEKELRDHMETLYLSLIERGIGPDQAQGEVLRAMGELNKLKEEYKAAWRRTLLGRMDDLRHQLKAWAVGCAVMLGVQLLVRYMVTSVFWMAISLPGDSQAPWIKMIRDTATRLSNSYLWFLIPLVPALIVGAYYLNRKFQTLRCPVWQISVGLSFHWAFIAMFHVWLEALDDHTTFWAELKGYMVYNVGYYSLTLALCILLGVVFGYMSVRMKKSVAA